MYSKEHMHLLQWTAIVAVNVGLRLHKNGGDHDCKHSSLLIVFLVDPINVAVLYFMCHIIAITTGWWRYIYTVHIFFCRIFLEHPVSCWQRVMWTDGANRSRFWEDLGEYDCRAARDLWAWVHRASYRGRWCQSVGRESGHQSRHSHDHRCIVFCETANPVHSPRWSRQNWLIFCKFVFCLFYFRFSGHFS